MENISPILSPDRELMLQHLSMLFGRALEGRIEITAIKTTGKEDGAGPRTRFFDVDELDEAADFAASTNADHMWNVYVGAALRREDVFPGKAADDSDFLRTYVVWADADDQVQVDHARSVYRERRIQPPYVVVTGRTPNTRAQLWWPLESPIDDIATLRATLRGIATELNTDKGVLTGKQLMRLAGSLAWPKPNKVGRVLERTEFVTVAGASREFDLAQLHHAFPPVERHEGDSSIADVEVRQGGALGLEEIVTDGREGYAFRLVRAHMHELIGTTGAEPTADELYRSVAPVYLAKTDQVRPGRGPEFLKAKCAEAVRAFRAGQIPFMRDLEEAVQTYAERARGEGVAHADTPFAAEPSDDAARDDLFEVLSIADIKRLPDADWIVHEAIPRHGLGFVYGAPGSYKSFVCYDLALSLAYRKETWLERAIKHNGSVLYLASEGSQGAKNRITAWQMANGVEADDGAFRLIRTSISFMNPEDIDKLERTVAAVVAASGPVDTVFVDTVSRVLPGADENLQKDMTLFVAACDRLRERFGATVIGVHHTNKNGDMRGSTVFLGQGDFIMRLDKDEDGKGGVLTCEKEKDAEDGWKVAFGVDKQAWTPVGRLKEESSLSVKWTGKPEAIPAGTVKWPPRDTLRTFQRLIEDAFKKGAPMSLAPQTKKDGRYAVTRLAAVVDVAPLQVQQVIETWLANGVLEVQEADSHSKLKGLKVVKWLD